MTAERNFQSDPVNLSFSASWDNRTGWSDQIDTGIAPWSAEPNWPSEPKTADRVTPASDHAVKTTIPLTPSDWRKLGIAAASGIMIGVGGLLISPAVPLIALVAGAVFTMFPGRSRRS